MSNTLAVATVMVAVVSTEAKQVAKGGTLTIEPIIGGFVLGIFLFSLVAINEKIASRFSILIIITALLVNGAALFGVTDKALGLRVAKIKTVVTPANKTK